MEKTKKKANANSALTARRVFAYIVLVFLTLLCLFSFYILIINSTRLHSEISKGFSILPGSSLGRNLKNLLSDGQLPVFRRSEEHTSELQSR